MEFLEGNTYELGVKLKDCRGAVVSASIVETVQIVVNGVEYYYGDGGVVRYDEERHVFVVPLTEEETFAMKGVVQWQARVKFSDGTIRGTRPRREYVYDSITRTRLSN